MTMIATSSPCSSLLPTSDLDCKCYSHDEHLHHHRQKQQQQRVYFSNFRAGHSHEARAGLQFNLGDRHDSICMATRSFHGGNDEHGKCRKGSWSVCTSSDPNLVCRSGSSVAAAAAAASVGRLSGISKEARSKRDCKAQSAALTKRGLFSNGKSLGDGKFTAFDLGDVAGSPWISEKDDGCRGRGGRNRENSVTAQFRGDKKRNPSGFGFAPENDDDEDSSDGGKRWRVGHGHRHPHRGNGSSSTTVVHSHAPEDTVYVGPQVASPKRVTLRHVAAKYRRNEPITMVTAYDYPSAVHVEEAGIDLLLVGDSVAMVVHGHDSTLPVTMDDMLLHCRAVARGARRPLLIGDLPFGSYEQSPEQAVASSMRMLKEGAMDAVKLEGGSVSRVRAVRAVVDAGVAVMGHVGLTPQAISVLGGFRPQGKKSNGAIKILEQALELQDAGCFAIVLECLPSPVASAITSALRIPTIGIGAGPYTSGQVLVYHDLLGMMQHPHHAKVTPKFCKKYADVGGVIQGALSEFRQEVQARIFPSDAYSPYRMEEEELKIFGKELQQKFGMILVDPEAKIESRPLTAESDVAETAVVNNHPPTDVAVTSASVGTTSIRGL